MNTTQKFYSSDENCISDLAMARELFGSKSTTEKQYDGMLRGLAAIYLYCPEKFRDTVLATIDEAHRRELYFRILWDETKRN